MASQKNKQKTKNCTRTTVLEGRGRACKVWRRGGSGVPDGKESVKVLTVSEGSKAWSGAWSPCTGAWSSQVGLERRRCDRWLPGPPGSEFQPPVLRTSGPRRAVPGQAPATCTAPRVVSNHMPEPMAAHGSACQPTVWYAP